MDQNVIQQNALPTALRILGIVLSVGVAIASYRYVAGVGFVPDLVATNSLISPWLLIHVLGSATALLVGPFQFLTAPRPSKRGIHRALGRVYVVGCLVGAVSGIPLALGASTGVISTMGFGLLAVAWFATVATGWRKAVEGRIAEHREWMIRSFALTFAAVTLRLYLPIAGMLPIDFADGYRAISFLCWVPNLAVAELWLIRRRSMPALASN